MYCLNWPPIYPIDFNIQRSPYSPLLLSLTLMGAEWTEGLLMLVFPWWITFIYMYKLLLWTAVSPGILLPMTSLRYHVYLLAQLIEPSLLAGIKRMDTISKVRGWHKYYEMCTVFRCHQTLQVFVWFVDFPADGWR